MDKAARIAADAIKAEALRMFAPPIDFQCIAVPAGKHELGASKACYQYAFHECGMLLAALSAAPHTPEPAVHGCCTKRLLLREVQ